MANKTTTDPNAFPSLFAFLTATGHNSFTVRCSATHRTLGGIWWSAVGTAVTWSYRAPDGQVGDRSTKRGAVQTLRDLANSNGAALLPFDEILAARAPKPAATTPTAAAPAAPGTKATPTPTPTPPAQRIDWADYARKRTDINVGDLTTAIAAAFERHKRK